MSTSLPTRLALLAAATLACAVAARPPRAVADAPPPEDVPVRGAECALLETWDVDWACPQIEIPEREDPWLPVIALPERPADRPCDTLALVVDNIVVQTCGPGPDPGPEPATAATLQVAGGRAGLTRRVGATPDYGGPSDILPFQLCLNWDEVPEELAIEIPGEDAYIARARVRAFCCAVCGTSSGP